MKKLLAMFLVLGMASIANATILDLVVVSITDEQGQPTDRDGLTPETALAPSDYVLLGLRLNENPTPSPGGFPGYGLTSFDLDVHVTGEASLSLDIFTTFYGATGVAWDKSSAVTMGAVIQSSPQSIDQLTGVITAPADVPGEVMILGGGILFHCEGGDGLNLVPVDLTLNGLTQYSEYVNSLGDPMPPVSMGGGWKDLTADQLGGLELYQIPEPITMALLGVGGLLLRRRR